MLKQSYFFDYDQTGRRGHSKKLFKRRSRLGIKKFAFSNRIVDRRTIHYLNVVLHEIQ